MTYATIERYLLSDICYQILVTCARKILLFVILNNNVWIYLAISEPMSRTVYRMFPRTHNSYINKNEKRIAICSVIILLCAI